MADRPLLVFPIARRVAPPPGRQIIIKKPHVPERARQVERLIPQLTAFQEDFQRYSATIQGSVQGLEPESVLVVEIAGNVEDFRQAVEATDGLEWLGEWDSEGAADDEFYEVNTANARTEKPVAGRLFLSMTNEAGMRELLGLWATWQRGAALPRGRTKWRDVFSQTRVLRRWGIEETLQETGMLARWQALLDEAVPADRVTCQIELFYRQSEPRRRANEGALNSLVTEFDGQFLGPFIDMPEIAFHAAKVTLPADRIRRLIEAVTAGQQFRDARLFNFQGVMYFRPTGQAIVSEGEERGEATAFPDGATDLPPVVAILDGLPNMQHAALRGRLLLDDVFDVANSYLVGERRHGSAMASLVIHGEQPDPAATLTRPVFVVPVLQPDPQARIFERHAEHVPDSTFLEDRIHRAIRRMRENAGGVAAQAPGVKIVNISVGDSDRPLIHSASPLARLLDWLAWKYRILFCVSAGNFEDDIDLGMPHAAFAALPANSRTITSIRSIARQLSGRRLLAPAEAINAITVGALNSDESGPYVAGFRTSLLDHPLLFSPISRFGHGIRRSLKPEIFMPGGRQLYNIPVGAGQHYRLFRQLNSPGQRVAFDSPQAGELSRCVHTRGTSNAAALATRAAARIHEAVAELRTLDNETIPDEFVSVVVKTLLVHGARQDADASTMLTTALRTPENGRKFKEISARYLGYGSVDVERVLECTEQRGTVIAFGAIEQGQILEYRLPLPLELSGGELWRRMVITLSWFSPMNFAHRHLREAKLELQPVGKWGELPLHLGRINADHNQVLRGTVQHEVLEGNNQIAVFLEGREIAFQVTCGADATNRLDEQIPYALAITLEVGDGVGIPIYTRLREGIRQQVRVPA